MKNYLVLCLTLTLIACGPSQKDRDIAAITCSVMGETRIMDGAIRIREMNAAREKIGGEAFLRGDNAIKEAFEYGLCQELVLNENYDESLQTRKNAKRERERIAAEEQRIADSKPAVKETFHPNGKLKSRVNYRSKNDGGEKHGLERRWYENGQLSSERTYENGKKHGFSKHWYENGQLRWERTFENGEKHGLQRYWDENGKLDFETHYENGKQNGLYRSWRENGQLWYEYCYSNGEKIDMSNCQE